MALDQKKYEHKHEHILRDIRPMYVRMADGLRTPVGAGSVFVAAVGSLYFFDNVILGGDFLVFFSLLLFLWLTCQDRSLAFKMPLGAKWKDRNNMHAGRDGTAKGILYLGNTEKTNEEVWFTNEDARTHILYLGTTGSGKTEGRKSRGTNARSRGSGIGCIDGKADEDLGCSGASP